ncbi:ATP-binding protein [Oceanithermus sp.]
MSRWREAWEASQQGLVLLEDGRVRYLNPAAARLLDVRREGAEGRPAAYVLRHHRLLELARGGGEATLALGGRVLHVRATGGAVFLDDATEIERTRAELEQERRMLAHEFRTPVAGLAGLLEVLRDEPEGPERERVLALMADEVARLLRLVQGQGAARAEAWSPEELRPRLVRLLPGAEAVLWQVAHRTTADRDRVYQVLVNLVENALNYGAPPVMVRTRRLEDGRLALEVVDAGGPLADYERLFEPGSRGVHAAGTRGSGLGLALVRRIARGWGGEAYGVRLEEGNAFGVTLPEEEGEVDA